MRCVRFVLLLVITLSIPLSAGAQTTLCHRLLTSDGLKAAFYRIDIGTGENAPEMGEVIVIRDGESKQSPEGRENGNDHDRYGPEMGVPDPNNEKPRPDINVPYPEPTLQEIVPEPKKPTDRHIPIIIIPIPDKLPPLKKPTKPLPN